MNAKRFVVAGFAGLLLVNLVVVSAILGFVFISKAQATPLATATDLKTYYYETTTNENGGFSILHGIDPQRETIVAVTVAVRSNTNRSWYALLSQESLKSRYAWGQSTSVASENAVGGYIEDRDDFAGSSVKIVVFTKPR